MPIYQNSTVASDKLVLGNCTVEVAASVAATFINVGAGILNSFNHVPEMYDTQAGNAPDPITGLASETVTVDFEMIEYDSSVLAVMHGGLFTSTTTSSVSTIHAGGLASTLILSRAWRFTNTRRNAAGSTVQTILTVYKATLDAGPGFAFKSDNDTDPIMVMAATLTAEIDGTLTAGQQLYNIKHDES